MSSWYVAAAYYIITYLISILINIYSLGLGHLYPELYRRYRPASLHNKTLENVNGVHIRDAVYYDRQV